MSNERTLPKSQGAGRSRAGHWEAQLQAAGQAEEGKAVKGAGTAVTARDLLGEQPQARPIGWAMEVCINHNVPWANGRCREGSRDYRTKAEHDEEGTSAGWEFVRCVFLFLGKVNDSYQHQQTDA